MRRPPLQTVRADFPHTASLVKLVSLVSFPCPLRASFALIPTDAPCSTSGFRRAAARRIVPFGGSFDHSCFLSSHLHRFLLQVEALRSTVITRFTATTTSSDSCARFRGAGLPSSRLNCPNTPPLFTPRGRLRVASRSSSTTCPPLRFGAFCFPCHKSSLALLFGFTQNENTGHMGVEFNEA